MKSLTKLIFASALIVGCGSAASVSPPADSGVESSLSDSGSDHSVLTLGNDAESCDHANVGVTGDSGHVVIFDSGIDSGYDASVLDAGHDSGNVDANQDASSCQEQFKCCLQDCDNDKGAHCEDHHCQDKCQEQLERCGCQH